MWVSSVTREEPRPQARPAGPRGTTGLGVIDGTVPLAHGEETRGGGGQEPVTRTAWALCRSSPHLASAGREGQSGEAWGAGAPPGAFALTNCSHLVTEASLSLKKPPRQRQDLGGKKATVAWEWSLGFGVRVAWTAPPVPLSLWSWPPQARGAWQEPWGVPSWSAHVPLWAEVLTPDFLLAEGSAY